MTSYQNPIPSRMWILVKLWLRDIGQRIRNRMDGDTV